MPKRSKRKTAAKKSSSSSSVFRVSDIGGKDRGEVANDEYIKHSAFLLTVNPNIVNTEHRKEDKTYYGPAMTSDEWRSVLQDLIDEFIAEEKLFRVVKANEVTYHDVKIDYCVEFSKPQEEDDNPRQGQKPGGHIHALIRVRYSCSGYILIDLDYLRINLTNSIQQFGGEYPEGYRVYVRSDWVQDPIRRIKQYLYKEQKPVLYKKNNKYCNNVNKN